MGRPLPPLVALAIEDGDLHHASALLHEYYVLGRDYGSRRIAVEALHGFALLAGKHRQTERALHLISMAAKLLDPAGMPFSSYFEEDVERLIQEARCQIGDDAVDAAMWEGALLPVERAIAAVLAADTMGPVAVGAPAVSAGHGFTVVPSSLLTPRERQVAVLVAQGLTNRQIAEHLVIGETTVASHVANCLAKLGLRSRTLIAVKARELGIE
jgi:non-specific serine/threonine protein kinase